MLRITKILIKAVKELSTWKDITTFMDKNIQQNEDVDFPQIDL